jgi:hypothetical protein
VSTLFGLPDIKKSVTSSANSSLLLTSNPNPSSIAGMQSRIYPTDKCMRGGCWACMLQTLLQAADDEQSVHNHPARYRQLRACRVRRFGRLHLRKGCVCADDSSCVTSYVTSGMQS